MSPQQARALKIEPISPRTWALAKKALGYGYDVATVAFDGPSVCRGMSRDKRSGKIIRCHIDGHSRSCRGGKTYWYVGTIGRILPALQVLGSGPTPEAALRCAIRRRSEDSARHRAIEAERNGSRTLFARNAQEPKS